MTGVDGVEFFVSRIENARGTTNLGWHKRWIEMYARIMHISPVLIGHFCTCPCTLHTYDCIQMHLLSSAPLFPSHYTSSNLLFRDFFFDNSSNLNDMSNFLS